MGNAYSKYVLGIERPRIGLLNVGSEEGKGNAVVKDAFQRLKASGLNFVGNVEARELLDGGVDVAVCDGFVGNVVLKLTEGIGLGIFAALKETLLQSVVTKLAALAMKPALRQFRDKFDYAEYGGAPFLGVAGGCFKAHGSSNERAWYMACTQAARFVDNDVLRRLGEDLGTAQSQVDESSTD
jgi:phosphate acyltransferase